MRSTWLFYIIFPGKMQHSTEVVFFISLGEVFRRFMWNFFRMENEHMANARRCIVSRDVPLPFSIPEFRVEKKATMEGESALLDYSRMDRRRSEREKNAEYNC